MNPIYKNIKKEYIFQFVRNTSFSEAIWVLFLASRGMNLIEIGVLESIFHITGMLMEVPTGFIADRYGRRTSRILGRIMSFISCLIMLASKSFYGFALSFVIDALSFNLESGAGDALIYDSLSQCGREGEYMKVRGRDEICFQLSHVISLVAGGIAATVSYDLAYGITALINLLAFGISLSFKEPQISNSAKNESLLQNIRRSMNAIWQNRGVLPYFLHLEIFSVYFTTVYFYFQNFLKGKGYVEYQIGLMLGITYVLGALVSSQAYKIEKLFGEKPIVIVTGILPGALFMMMAATNAEPVAFFLITVLDSFMFVVFGDYINKRIPSEHRATLLSFESMLFSIMMIVFFPVIGTISEYYGFKASFWLIAGLSIITGILTAILLTGTYKKKEN